MSFTQSYSHSHGEKKCSQLRMSGTERALHAKKKNPDRGKKKNRWPHICSVQNFSLLSSVCHRLFKHSEAWRGAAASGASGSLVYTKPLCLGSNLQNKRGVCVTAQRWGVTHARGAHQLRCTRGPSPCWVLFGWPLSLFASARLCSASARACGKSPPAAIVSIWLHSAPHHCQRAYHANIWELMLTRAMWPPSCKSLAA